MYDVTDPRAALAHSAGSDGRSWRSIRASRIPAFLQRAAAGAGRLRQDLVWARTEFHSGLFGIERGRRAGARRATGRVRRAHPRCVNRGRDHHQGRRATRGGRFARVRAARALEPARDRAGPHRAAVHHALGRSRQQVREQHLLRGSQALCGAGRAVARAQGRLQAPRLQPRRAVRRRAASAASGAAPPSW